MHVVIKKCDGRHQLAIGKLRRDLFDFYFFQFCLILWAANLSGRQKQLLILLRMSSFIRDEYSSKGRPGTTRTSRERTSTRHACVHVCVYYIYIYILVSCTCGRTWIRVYDIFILTNWQHNSKKQCNFQSNVTYEENDFSHSKKTNRISKGNTKLGNELTNNHSKMWDS